MPRLAGIFPLTIALLSLSGCSETGNSLLTSKGRPATLPNVQAPSTNHDDNRDELNELSVRAAASDDNSGDNTQTPAYSVGGMVGQINGQAIYASRVLEPLDEQLTRLGKSMSPAAFRQEVRKPIVATLDEIAFNSLIITEAERDLSQQEQYGLKAMMNDRRQELIRKWGSGSLMVADHNLSEKTGKNLEETLQDLRQQVLVQRYLSLKLLPKINVTRKDIERYYHDHLDQFQPKPGRTIRMIQAADTDAADQIDQLLAKGTGFVEAASSRFNHYKPQAAGLFGENVAGDQVFGIAALNQALLKLNAGRYSDRIPAQQGYYWVFVETISSGQGRTLAQVQQEIEELLRRQRFQKLTQFYRQKLFADGSYNPLDEMVDSLVEVAVSRYAQAD